MVISELRFASVLGAVLLLLGAVPSVQAQEFGRPSELDTNSAYFFYARPGDATIQVNVLGVRLSGLYEIPEGTDLSRLLALSGGMGLQPRTDREEPPEITIRLYRSTQPGGGDPTFEARYDEILRGRAEGPVLEENDVVMVDVVQPSEFTFSQGLSIVSTLTSVALIIVRILD